MIREFKKNWPDILSFVVVWGTLFAVFLTISGFLLDFKWFTIICLIISGYGLFGIMYLFKYINIP